MVAVVVSVGSIRIITKIEKGKADLSPTIRGAFSGVLASEDEA